MIPRERVEAMLAEEELALDTVVELLRGAVPLTAWPRDAYVALALALDEPAASAGEQWKVNALRQHLFGGDEPPPLPYQGATPEDRNRAARLRSGLSSRVRLHAGRYLSRASR